MMMKQAEALKGIEELIRRRYDLLKLYPVLSAEAMQCLEQNDTEAFDSKLFEREALTEKADAISIKINALVAELDENTRSFVENHLKHNAQSKDYPEWGTGIAQSMERTYKLLQGCALFDVRLMARAKAVHMELSGKLGRIHAQRKINSLYAEKSAVKNGTHIHFSSK